jgi:PAS domain S-box-containing protein
VDIDGLAWIAAIAGASDDAIIASRLDRSITYWNDSAERIYGYSREEALGQSMLMLSPDPEGEEARVVLSRLLRGEVTHFHEAVRKRKDGTLVSVAIAISPIMSEDGDVVGAATIARDITERLAVLQERQELDARVERVKRQELVVQLAGGVAHDFNNLLAGVLGYAELLRSLLPPGSREAQMAAEIAAAAGNAAELTAQMLDYAGRANTVPVEIDLRALVIESVALARMHASHDVVLTLEEVGAAIPVWAPASQLRRVVMNLLINAIESCEGGGTVRTVLSARAFGADDLRQYESDEPLTPGVYAAIDVNDDGVGIAPEIRPRIFEPFFTTKFLGRGLGLASAHGVVRAAGGGIRISSEPGVGTEFSMLIPSLEDGDEHPARTQESSGT